MSREPAKSGIGPRKPTGTRPAGTRHGAPKPQARRSKEPRKSPEPITQVTLKMRESLHRDLAKKAFNSDMTMRGYIMRALKQAGLGVTEADLVDGRKRTSNR